MGIEVEIDTPYPAGHIFGPNDKVEGVITVTLSKDTDIKNIVVKLKAIESTMVHYWVTVDNRRQRRTCTSTHQWYKLTWTVFPSKEIGAQTSGSYTLPQGVHKYPFCVQFPNDPQIPGTLQSVHSGWYSIRHTMKVTVHRDSHWKTDTRLEFAQGYSPSAPAAVLDDPSRACTEQTGELVRKYKNPNEGLQRIFSRSPRSSAQVKVIVESPAHGLPQAPRPLRLRLHVSTSLEVVLTHITVQLTSFTEFHAVDSWRRQHSNSESTTISIVSQPLTLTGTEFELSDYVHGAMIKGICPTVVSTLLNRVYTLEVVVTVADPLNLGRTRDITVRSQRTVLPSAEQKEVPPSQFPNQFPSQYQSQYPSQYESQYPQNGPPPVQAPIQSVQNTQYPSQYPTSQYPDAKVSGYGDTKSGYGDTKASGYSDNQYAPTSSGKTGDIPEFENSNPPPAYDG